MYRLLVVDNEEWIRKGIAETIPWQEYGVSVVGVAADAVEAMELVRKHHPDLVVTDIVMPGPSGVELLGWIKQEQPGSKVIMISGYDQFQYAREALRKGAFDYLLKPVEEVVLIETIQEAISLLQKERVRENQAERYTTSLEGLKQLFFMKLLDGKDSELFLSGDEDQYVGLSLTEELEYVCAIWSFGEHDITKLEMIQDLIEREILQQRPDMKADSLIMQNQIVLLCEGKEEVQTSLYKLLCSLNSIALLIPDCGCCISQSCKGISKLKAVVSETARTITNQFQLRGIIKVQELEKSQKEQLINCQVCIEEFLEQLQLSNQESMKVCSEQLVAGIMREAPGIGKAELGSILFQVMSDVAAQCQKEGISMQMPVTEKNEAVTWVFHLNTVEKAVDELFQFLDYLHDHMMCQEQTDKNYLIEKSLVYVKENFSKDISADEMSEYLNISKAYFSQLFSKEMGCPFTRYLTNYRIEYAKKMLEQTNDRIYEVAEASGYNDVKYFLKVFKKTTGVSPQVYRERGTIG